MLGPCFAEIWTRQRLEVWQAAHIVTEASHSNRFDRISAHIDVYQIGVAQFWHSVAISDQLNVILAQRRHFAPKSSLQSFCEFFAVTNMNSFLSLNHIKITSFSNKFEQLSFTWLFASVSSSAGVSLNTSKSRSLWKKWSVWQQINRLCYLVW